jgi:hypothetical protein
MDSRHAVIAGALVVAALAWWHSGHPGYETPEQREARVDKLDHDRTYGDGPALYRWRDAHGVLQITDVPPVGRKYERVEVRQDQNIIPMGGSTTPATDPNNPGAAPPKR